jgi:hypothetical protein
MTEDAVAVQPPADVTVTLKVPGARELRLCAVDPVFHKYVNGPLTPVAVTLAEPVLLLQVDGLVDRFSVIDALFVMTVVAELVQPFALVTVTV